MAAKKGFQKERDLVQKLWKAGFAAIRAPASGAKVKRVIYPDVIAIYHGKVFVFEVKYRSKPEIIYIEESKLKRLYEFAERAGGTVYIAVKYNGEEWHLIDPKMCSKTESGRLRIDPELLKKHGIRLSTFIARVKGQTLLTSFVD